VGWAPPQLQLVFEDAMAVSFDKFEVCENRVTPAPIIFARLVYLILFLILCSPSTVVG